MAAVESEKSENVYEQIRKLIERGRSLPEAFINRKPQGKSKVRGSNRPDATPGLTMEGGIPRDAE